MQQFYVHRLGAFALALAVMAGACSDAGTVADLADTGPAASPGAASMRAETSIDQTATAGTTVASTPRVVVKDARGAAVVGVSVTFTVTAGGGSVQNAATLTDASGSASAGRWTLGSTAGVNTVEARVGTLAPVVFVATGISTPVAAPSAYAITVRYLAAASARQQQAVANAVARWQTVITSDLMNIPVNAAAKACFPTQPAINEIVDDILIFVEFVDIDGVGKILGQAGPCYVRSDNSLPVVGHLKLDSKDLEYMERNGTLDDVVLHEIGHVLGVGTLWSTRSLISGASTDDPRFTGNWALNAYRGLGGVDAFIPVENTGGEGTRDGHWRETIFGNELMTGYISAASNPMSTMTIASLSDLGYGTNAGAASAFTLNKSTSSSRGGVDLHGRESLVRPKYKIDRSGRKISLE
ncbi:MAG: leishmanolysin-related zinc metalloendopeptidase [Gemmatimonadota bacterium]